MKIEHFRSFKKQLDSPNRYIIFDSKSRVIFNLTVNCMHFVIRVSTFKCIYLLHVQVI